MIAVTDAFMEVFCCSPKYVLSVDSSIVHSDLSNCAYSPCYETLLLGTNEKS